MSESRYAIYYAPPAGSALDDLGRAWLGRDAASGDRIERPSVPGIDPARAEALTESPRFYGFHGTLKAPFALGDGIAADDLLAAVEGFAATRPAVTTPPLVVAPLGSFVALVPSGPSDELAELAAACVEAFDAFRAPPPEAELARRRAAGLTAGQQALLDRWGYPFVMDEFRFHMTLTGRIADDAERAAVVEALRHLFAPVTAAPCPIDGLALFHQPDRQTPFTLWRRIPLPTAAGSGGSRPI